MTVNEALQELDAPGRRVKTAVVAGCLTLALALPAVAAPGAGDGTALLTLLEGSASVIVGSRAFVAAPGARLTPGTLVETDASAGLLRLEWPDGSLLDLGPSTRVMLRPPAGKTKSQRAPLFYLLQGWAKQTQAEAVAGQQGLAFDVAPFKGVLVSQVEGSAVTLFAETGGAQVTPRPGSAVLDLKPGQAAVAGNGGAPSVQPRPASAWLQRIPRSFRDTVAPRAGLFKGPAPTLRPAAALSYAALQPWLDAEPALRREFPRRFAELLKEPAFRAAVSSHLSQHPEWEPVLYPTRPASGARQTLD
jgi:hypothetical protein